MKRVSKYINRFFKAIDVSPFSYSTGKIIIFLIWGLNAVIFLGKDSLIDNNNTEQLQIVSREFFEYAIATDSEVPAVSNTLTLITGVTIDKELITCNPFKYIINPDRAPPASS